MEKKESGWKTSPFIPTLQYSNTPVLQSSNTPTLQHSNTPVLQSSGSGWLEISIPIHPVAHEALSAFLFDFGCEGLVTEDFPQPTLKAYLLLQREPEKVKNRIEAFLRQLASIFPQVGAPELSLQPIPHQDWNHTWRRFFRALKVTPHLTVLPAWEPIAANAPGHVIRIDPGPAFGTGQHATTQMCLHAIERLPKPEFWTMLDVGTGSGILAIYGAKLGSKRILALDTDPEALAWARINLALNHVSDAIELSLKPVEEWRETFSLVTANLDFGTILRLMPHFRRLLDPGGSLILSGLLDEQVEAVTEALTSHGYGEAQKFSSGEWACVAVEK